MRHAARHIEASILSWLVDHMTSLDWLEATQTLRPFGSGLPVFKVASTGRGDDPSGRVAAGTKAPQVNLVLAGSGTDEEQELGGSLVEASYDLLIDVIAAPRGLLMAFNEDIVDLLMGRTASPCPPFIDQATDSVVPGETLEILDVSWGFAKPERDDWILITARVSRTLSRSWA